MGLTTGTNTGGKNKIQKTKGKLSVRTLTLRMSSGLDSAKSSIEVPPSGHATITGP